jgi:hypothetical protein
MKLYFVVLHCFENILFFLFIFIQQHLLVICNPITKLCRLRVCAICLFKIEWHLLFTLWLYMRKTSKRQFWTDYSIVHVYWTYIAIKTADLNIHVLLNLLIHTIIFSKRMSHGIWNLHPYLYVCASYIRRYIPNQVWYFKLK